MLKHVMGDSMAEHAPQGARGQDGTQAARGKHEMRVARGMQILHGLVGLTFVVLALLHVPHPSPWLWVPYAAGAVLALLTLLPSLSIPISRILAISTTVLLFFFFAGFFTEVPKLASDWYTSQEGWSAVSLLVAAFTLIPVLSDYSCRCKARCREARSGRRDPAAGNGAKRPGFFTVPDHVGPRSP